MQQFFYSGQIRRFVIQFIRMMSNFQVEYGTETDGSVSLLRVPVFYGDGSRQAAQIIKNNSENTISSAPAIAVYISGLTYDRERVQDPYHVSKIHVRKRGYDEELCIPTQRQEDSMTIERLMPVPFNLQLKCDIWTSNTQQKLQLIEQICCLFNPSIEIQNTDNYVDWTSLSAVTLTDVNWSSRSVPVGTDDSIDIFTLTFELPIWLSAPAKVKKLGVIQKIIASIYDPKGELDEDSILESNLVSRQYITPLNYGIVYIGDEMILVKENEIATDTGKIGERDSWPALIDLYGKLKDGSSQIRLQIDEEGNEIVGTIRFVPEDKSILIFEPFEDTLPRNTIQPVDAIIDPISSSMNISFTLPETGTRYLLVNSVGYAENQQGAILWKGSGGEDLIANANDIIEFNGQFWETKFDSNAVTNVEYVSNLNTSIQYKWSGKEWVKSYHGHYRAGKWSLVL